MDRLLSYLLATIGAAIGLYLVYDGYQAWMTSENISTLQTQVTEISTQVIRQYARRPTRFQFGTLSVTTLTTIVPKSAITTSGTSTTITNPMGGTYNVLGNGTGGITAPVTTFAVFADNISESSCETIVKTFNTSGGSNGGFFYGYAVTTTGSTTPGTISTQFPDTDDNASSNCNTASSNGANNVAIEFVVNGNTN